MSWCRTRTCPACWSSTAYVTLTTRAAPWSSSTCSDSASGFHSSSTTRASWIGARYAGNLPPTLIGITTSVAALPPAKLPLQVRCAQVYHRRAAVRACVWPLAGLQLRHQAFHLLLA